MHKIVQVAVIGYGYASKTFHLPLIATTPGMNLATVCSRDPAKVHADWPNLAVVSDPQQVFTDPNISLIVIATPNDSHFPLACAALDAGKHVVVDKPFTVTLAQAQTLGQMAEARQCILSVFHNRRWDGDFLTLQALIASGELGSVRYLASHFDRFRPEVRLRWREQAGEGSGLWYDLAPHLLDQALQLFGMPETLFVDQAQLRDQAQTDDYFHAILAYPQCRVVLHASMSVAAVTPRFELHATAGSYCQYGLDPQEEALKQGVYPDNVSQWPRVGSAMGSIVRQQGEQCVKQAITLLPGNYPAYYLAIREAICGRGSNPVSAQQAIAVMQLLAAGVQSAKTGQTVTLTEG